MLPISLLIISIISLVFFSPKHFYNKEEIISLSEIASEDIHISMNLKNREIYSYYREDKEEDGKRTITSKSRFRFKFPFPTIAKLELKFKRSNDQEIYLIIHDKGFSSSLIPSLLSSKLYNFSGNHLTLEDRYIPYLSYLKTEITILIPENKSVYLDNSLKEVLSYLETVDYIDIDSVAGHTWKMTDRGFVKKPRTY